MPLRSNAARGVPNNNNTLLISLILVAIAIAVLREVVPLGTSQTKSQGGHRPPLISTTMITPRDTTGLTFTIDEPRQAYITVNRYSGSHVVINELDGPVIYTFSQKNFEGERHFNKGTYVISLVAQKGRGARGFVEVR